MPENNFADTFTGKLILGVALAVVSSVLGWFVSRVTYDPPPPQLPIARISPDFIEVPANETIEFTAAGSIPGSADIAHYRWSISGLPPVESPVARCVERTQLISCRFALPGTFAVSAEVTDTNGQIATAASTVRVILPGGYLGLNLVDKNDDASLALLFDVDWVKLQSHVPRLIVLFNPITQSAVYATQASPPPGISDPPQWRGAAAGLKIALPPMPPEATLAFEVALGEIGVVPVTLPFSEVWNAQTRGAVDAGFVLLGSPDEIVSARESGN